MAITQAVCTSFKQELLEGAHDFRSSGDTIYMALYTSSASLDASTTAYTADRDWETACVIAIKTPISL